MKLAVYAEAQELAVAVYRLSRSFPWQERFGLTRQIRRAAVSAGSNIAERCGHKGARAFLPYLRHSIGSANEVEYQAELSVQLGYCAGTEADIVLERVVRTRRMLIRLEAAIRKRLGGGFSPPATRNAPPDQPR